MRASSPSRRASSKDPSGKSATFGELAGLAQQIELPGPFKPKDPSAWKLIGLNKLPKVDTLPKTNGTAIYTIDVKMPNMLTCLLARPSRFHAKVKSFDPAPALAVPGVKEVFAVSQGVAVLADGYWAAKKGRDALKVDVGRGRHGSARQRPDRQGVRRPRQQAGRRRPQ